MLRCSMQRELQEVDKKVDAVRTQLEVAQMRRRRLKCAIHALKARAKEATGSLAAVAQAVAHVSERAVATQDSLSTDTSGMQLQPVHSRRQDYGTKRNAVPQPIASFRCCASVAYDEIAACMLYSHACTAPAFDLIQQALAEYQLAVSNHKSLTQQEICWFIRFPYQIAPNCHLSYSAGLNSPECALTISLCYSIASAECMFLTLELEALEAATAGVPPPSHPFAKECEALLDSGQNSLLSGLPVTASVPPAVLELIQNPPEPDLTMLSHVRTLNISLCFFWSAAL
jgi:hypothetical protein